LLLAFDAIVAGSVFAGSIFAGSIFAGSIFAGSIFAGSILASVTSAFVRGTAQQVSRRGSFELPCDANTAFPLFSPEGERKWIDGWDPTPVFPQSIDFARDTVFRTGSGDEQAVWTIVEADGQSHRAEYVRVAPHSHCARIVVNIEPLEAQRSKVVVSYTITAFAENSSDLLAAFSEEAYAAKMNDWQQQIGAYLRDRAR
jgi:hypothetical protein